MDVDPKSRQIGQKIASQLEVMAKHKELAILKCHLMIEEALREFCSEVVASPEDLKKAKLSFVQLCLVSKALAGEEMQHPWVWDAIHHLNQIRNKLAHALTTDESFRNREKELFLLLDKNLPEEYVRASEKNADELFVHKLGLLCAWASGALDRVAKIRNQRSCAS